MMGIFGKIVIEILRCFYIFILALDKINNLLIRFYYDFFFIE